MRNDNRNLAEEWRLNHGPNARVVRTLPDLKDIDVSNTEYLLGLFADSHCAYDDSRDIVTDPSISDMTEKAVEV